MKKKLISFLLVLTMAMSVLPVTALAANTQGGGDVGVPMPEDYNVLSTVNWSYQTITDETVNEDSYKGKIQVLIFFRTSGTCFNSNSTIRSLAAESWIKSDNIKVIAVGCGERGEDEQTVKNKVISYKQEYAPDCEDIVFCYATNSQMWTTISSLEALIGNSSVSLITYAVNYIFDSEDHLRFTWQGSYLADYYSSVLSLLDHSIEPASGFYTVKIDGTNDYDSAYAILASLNSYRQAKGKSVLTMDKDLLATAMQRAAEIAVYYDHTRPDYSTCFTAFPTKFLQGSSRENIAAGFGSADAVMTGWKNSSGHNANMLADDNRSVGIGVFVDSDGTRYWVQVFSSQEGTAETPVSSGMKETTATITAASAMLKTQVSPTSAALHGGETATFTVTSTNAGWDGSTPELYLTYAKSSEENVVTVSIGDDGKAVVTPVGAGNTTVKLGFASSNSGEPLTTDVAVSVAATGLVNSMFTVDTSPETYDGTPITKTIASTLTLDKEYTAAYTNNTNAGTATITITGKGLYSGELTYSFVINKATREITASADKEQLVADSQTAAITIVDNAKDDAPTYTYATSNAGVATVADGTITPVAAGEATITVTAPATTNYLSGSATVNIKVIELPTQELSFAESTIAKVYGDEAFTNKAVNASEGGGTITYTSSDETVATVDKDSGEVTVVGAGETVITATAAYVENRYGKTEASYNLTVNPREITIQSVEVPNKIYDGTTSATVTGVGFDGVAASDTLELNKDYTAKAEFADANAGEDKMVSVTVELLNGNYTLKETRFSTSGTIQKASAFELTKDVLMKNEDGYTRIVTLADLTGWPTDMGSDPTCAVSGTHTGLTASAEGASITLKSNGSGTDSEGIEITVSGMTNYQDSKVTLTVTYVDKTPVKFVGVTVSDQVYNGEAATYTGALTVTDESTGETVELAQDELKFVWQSVYTVEADTEIRYRVVEAPVNAGNYQLHITTSDDSEYIGYLTLPLTISKAPLTIAPKNISIYVGETLPSEFTMTYTGFVHGETKDVLEAGGDTPIFVLRNGDNELADSNTAGSYTILWSNKDAYTVTAQNYEITKADGTLTISTRSAPSIPSGPSTPAKPDEPVKPTEPANVYVDVDEDAWYYDAISYVVEKGLMEGTGEKTFEPDSTTTRAMLVTILYRLENEPTVTKDLPFADVPAGEWYTEAVTWAAASGIVNGMTKTTFAPMDPVTREQMAAILYRYANYKGYDLTKQDDLAKFNDAASISDWADIAVRWTVGEGLINGTSTTTIDPTNNSTRAQIATVLMRFCEEIAQ